MISRKSEHGLVTFLEKSLLKTVSERRVTEKKSLGRSRKGTSSDIIDEVGACEIKTQ